MPRLHVELGWRIALRRPGAIDEHVYRAEAPLDVGDQLLRRRGIDEIGGEGGEFSRFALQRTLGRGKIVAAARGDREARAFRGESFGARKPDTFASAGDEDDSSREIQIHGIPCRIAKSAKSPAKTAPPTQLL